MSETDIQEKKIHSGRERFVAQQWEAIVVGLYIYANLRVNTDGEYRYYPVKKYCC